MVKLIDFSFKVEQIVIVAIIVDFVAYLPIVLKPNLIGVVALLIIGIVKALSRL